MKWVLLPISLLLTGCSGAPDESVVKSFINNTDDRIRVEKVSCTEQMNEQYVCFVAWSEKLFSDSDMESHYQASEAVFNKVGDRWTSNLQSAKVIVK